MFRKSVMFALQQYKCWLFSPRILLILYLCIFMNDNLTAEMVAIADTTGYILNIVEPITLILSKSVNIALIPIIYISLMADYPQINSARKFYIYRLTRRGWIISELLFTLASSVTYIISLLCVTFIYCFDKVKFNNEWSGYTTHLYQSHPDIYRNHTSLFLTSQTYSQGAPVDVLFHSVALILMYTIIISLIITLFKLLGNGGLGVAITIAISLCALATDGGTTKLMWIFPITHTVYGWHFKTFMRTEHFTILGSYIYLSAIITLLLVIIIIISKKVNIE